MYLIQVKVVVEAALVCSKIQTYLAVLLKSRNHGSSLDFLQSSRSKRFVGASVLSVQKFICIFALK